METQLVYDTTRKSLGLRVRETILTQGNGILGNLALKVHGVLNTRTGQLDYNGSLTKFLTGAVRRRNIYVAKAKLRIGPMVSFDSKTDDIVGGLLLKKHTAIGNNFDLWLKIAASAEVNTRTKQPLGRGHVRLSKSIYNFTERQDVRLAVGYRGTMDDKGNVKGDYYGQLRENNWALHTDFKGYMGLRYDL
jgi:hypothetical protein